MTEYYVLMDHGQDGGMFTLGKHATRQDAKRSIAWQRRGGFEQPAYVCRWDNRRALYYTTAGQTFFAPKSDPYNKSAGE